MGTRTTHESHGFSRVECQKRFGVLQSKGITTTLLALLISPVFGESTADGPVMKKHATLLLGCMFWLINSVPCI
jgi:hypothetical protein